MKRGLGINFALFVLCVFVFSQPTLAEYPFKSQPSEIYPMVAKLQSLAGKVEYVPCESEERLRSWLANNPTDSQWAEAFLIASGDCDSASRKKHMAQLDKLTEELRKKVAKLSVAEQGEAILKHLHSAAMHKAYVEKQTSLSTLLDTGEFNCVSSTALYLIVSQRLKLKLDVIEFPGSAYMVGHVLPILLDGDRRIDIETTNPDGFNIREKITKGGGYAFGIKNLADGTAIDKLGLLLSVYNNRAVDAGKSERHFDALRLRLTMLALAPDKSEQQADFANAFANWVFDSSKAQKYEEAIAVGRIGLQIAPAAELLNQNMRVVHEQLASAMIAQHKDGEVAELYANAVRDWPQAGYGTEMVNTYLLAAQSAKRENKWTQAIEILTRGAEVASDKAQLELRQQRVSYYRVWSQSELSGGNFAAAADVLHQALEVLPGEADLVAGVVYLAQESFSAIDEKSGPEEVIRWSESLKQMFPSADKIATMAESHAHRQIQRQLDSKDFDKARQTLEQRRKLLSTESADEMEATIFDAEAQESIDRKDWKGALETYKLALKKFPQDGRLLNNAPIVYDNWACISIDKKDWTEAIRIYGLGLVDYPGNNLLTGNLAYCQQFVAAK